MEPSTTQEPPKKSTLQFSLLNFILILIIALLISGAATGTAVYFALQGRIESLQKKIALLEQELQNTQSTDSDDTEQTSLLQQKINALQNQLAAASQANTNTNTAANTNTVTEPDPTEELTKEEADQLSTTQPTYTLSQDDIPVAVYTPAGLFTDAMKQELWTKLASPYFDWHNEQGLVVYTMNIELTQDKPAGFLYKVDAIGKDHAAGFLWAEEGKDMPFWIPGCMTPCEFSAEFTAEHPEVVAEYEKAPQ